MLIENRILIKMSFHAPLWTLMQQSERMKMKINPLTNLGTKVIWAHHWSLLLAIWKHWVMKSTHRLTHETALTRSTFQLPSTKSDKLRALQKVATEKWNTLELCSKRTWGIIDANYRFKNKMEQSRSYARTIYRNLVISWKCSERLQIWTQRHKRKVVHNSYRPHSL